VEATSELVVFRDYSHAEFRLLAVTFCAERILIATLLLALGVPRRVELDLLHLVLIQRVN